MPPESEDRLLAQALEDAARYARTRTRSRRWHWITELSSLFTGAATVVAAGIGAPPAVTATVAGATVFIGGFRQVFNYTERYVLAAEAWTRLRLAIQRYQLVPEEDRDDEVRQHLLDEVEATANDELQAWAAHRRGLRSGTEPSRVR